MFNDLDDNSPSSPEIESIGASKRNAEQWQAISEYMATTFARDYPTSTKQQWLDFFAGKASRPVPAGTKLIRR